MSKRAIGWLLVALASLGLAQVSVEGRWRYTPFAQKDTVSAERLLRYTFAAEGERLRFEVRVDGRVVARFAKRASGELDFVLRILPQVERREGLVVAHQVAKFDEATTTTVATTKRRTGRRTVTTTEIVEVRAPRTLVDVALELPFAGVTRPATLSPRLKLFQELEAGRSYELLAGRWGAGHELVVYVTPLAD